VNEILPPEKPDNSESDDSRRGNHFLIEHLHYHANDLSELRKIAETSPELAEKVVEQRDRENERVIGSYNLGLIVSGGLLVAVLFAVVLLIIFAGIIETMVSIAAILAVAILIRVIVSGQWSDTSWIGKFVDMLIGGLGGKPSDD
jgi:hypothetical protein